MANSDEYSRGRRRCLVLILTRERCSKLIETCLKSRPLMSNICDIRLAHFRVLSLLTDLLTESSCVLIIYGEILTSFSTKQKWVTAKFGENRSCGNHVDGQNCVPAHASDFLASLQPLPEIRAPPDAWLSRSCTTYAALPNAYEEKMSGECVTWVRKCR